MTRMWKIGQRHVNRRPLVLDTAYFVCITISVFAERFPISVFIARFLLATGIKCIDLSRFSTCGVFLMRENEIDQLIDIAILRKIIVVDFSQRERYRFRFKQTFSQIENIGYQDQPLNFFIYPYVEKKGHSVKDVVKITFTYRVLKFDALKDSH